MAGSSQARSHPAIYGREPFLGELQNPAPGFEEFLQYHVGNKHAEPLGPVGRSRARLGRECRVSAAGEVVCLQICFFGFSCSFEGLLSG